MSLDELKEPFINMKPVPFISLVTGRKIPTPEEVETMKAARHQPRRGSRQSSPRLTSRTRLSIRSGSGSMSISSGSKTSMTHRTLRRLCSPIAAKRLTPSSRRVLQILSTKASECKDFLTIRTLEDAKFLILYHQAEGIPPARSATICARLEDNPVLWRSGRPLATRRSTSTS